MSREDKFCRSQTMNQRARHAFVSFTGSDNRKHETMRVRDERNDRGLRDRSTDVGEEGESGRVKRRNDCQGQRLRCPLLMPANVAGDIALKVSTVMRMQNKQREIRDKSKSAVFHRPSLFISYAIRKRKSMEAIYSDLLEWIDAANSRGAKLSFVRN